MATSATVYILRCRDGSYYVGCTRDAIIDHRLTQHNQGYGGRYTANQRPVALAWAEIFTRYDDAFRCERQLKHWSRPKKEALIRGDWNRVHVQAGNKYARRKHSSEEPE